MRGINQIDFPSVFVISPPFVPCRLCEADVLGSKLVALNQSGSVYVWELGGPVGPRVVWAPEADGWHVARWGGSDVLVTGHQNGDLTLYHYDGQNSVKITV